MVSSQRLLSASCLAGLAAAALAFQPSPVLHTARPRDTRLRDSASDVEAFLAANYPSASALLSQNGDAMKAIVKSEAGFTLFAPNEAAFAALGEAKRAQLDDVRNEEMLEKIASYHVVLEPVTADQLFASWGLVMEGGEVPAERSVSRGFFGVGGKENGRVALSGAKVVRSMEFADATKTGIVHEMDGFVSPTVLWRYADQLRIPGSS
jgi:hypothetical protein